MIVCSFHTGAGYAIEAERLRASLDRVGLAYRIDQLDSLGSWNANITLKPSYIQRVMREHNEPVLWVDADAEFHAVPVFDVGHDVAVHYLAERELLAGTVWLNQTEAAHSVIDDWVRESKVGEWDQVTLQRILKRRTDVRVHRLPPEYCCIFDISRRQYPGVVPIIEHHQASRRLKREVSHAPKPAASHR